MPVLNGGILAGEQFFKNLKGGDKMRKHYFKKGVACLLSAALVLTGTGVMPGAVKTASAAVADDVAAALLKTYDMTSSSGITVAGTNSAGVTIKDGVLTVPGNGAAAGYAENPSQLPVGGLLPDGLYPGRLCAQGFYPHLL